MEEADSDLELSDSEEIWPLIARSFEHNSLFPHQMQSYNDLIKNSIQKIIDEAKEIVVDCGLQCKLVISLGKFRREKFTPLCGVYPKEARLRRMAYSAPLFVNVSLSTKHYEGDLEVSSILKEAKEMCLGEVPVMVGSEFCRLCGLSDERLRKLGECPSDPGGYFIVNGIERVFIAQERMAFNHVMVFKEKQPSKYEYVAEIRSRGESQNKPPSTLYLHITPHKVGSTRQCIDAKIPFIKSSIPMVIVFRALGFIAHKDIVELICCLSDVEMVNLLRHSLKQESAIQTQQAALEFIGQRAARANTPREEWIQCARDIIQKELLPHVGLDTRKKACNFGYIVYRLLLCVLGRVAEDDRDHFGNRRLDLAGCLLGDLLRVELRKFSHKVTKTVQKLISKGKDATLDSAMISVAKTMTSALKYSFATGNFGLVNAEGEAVLPVLNRVTYISTLSQLRRSYTPLAYKGTVVARQLHNTHWGRMCPVETPEGQACGLVKNLALMVRISVGSVAGAVLDSLESCDLQRLEETINFEDLSKFTKIFVNGCWVGIHENPDDLEKILRDEKRRKIVKGIDIAVVRNRSRKELWINTDAGRCCRPLLLVERLRLLLKRKHIEAIEQGTSDWKDLLREGLIEYIDSKEEENTLISISINALVQARLTPEEAYTDTYTHCEIHPSLILGICASIIPFPDHNHSPRNTSASNMSKQAVGIYATNYQHRMDTSACLLDYPQKPLVTTRAMEHLCLSQLPAGINAVVAICSYSGYNEKDAIIMNKSSIDRGFLRSRSYHTYSDNLRNRGTLVHEDFGIPDRTKTKDIHASSYYALDIDGFPSPGVPIKGGDIVIGKTSHIDSVQYDRSTRLSPGGRQRVDQVQLSTDEDGYKFVKVRTRSVRIPTIGDKFSTRHGQKATVGMTFNQEDMPWTVDGITPDIIINPHSIPTRMTINLLMENILGKNAACKGMFKDATPFTQVTIEEIMRRLHECGYQKYGEEKMYSGHTGRVLCVDERESNITTGLVYYQRLKHMVDDKIHSRGRGPVQPLTRQPTKGRAHDGGLRVGEMERDCVIAHGAAHFLKERLFDLSDPYSIHVCGRCGLIAIANLMKLQFGCTGCKNRTDIVQVHIPYACKLLFQELMARPVNGPGLDRIDLNPNPFTKKKYSIQTRSVNPADH